MKVAFVPKRVRTAEGAQAVRPIQPGDTDEDILSTWREMVASIGGLPAGADPARANVLIVAPHGVVREVSPVKRSVYRMGGAGRFIHGGRFSDDMTVNVLGGEEVDIVNTGEGVLVAVELPEAPAAVDETLRTEE